jgi:Uma2 family endonuclease
MTKPPPFPTPHGPFRADQLRSGDPYELSQGHAVLCLPTGGRGSRANLLGGQVLETDPDVESAGVDTGFAPTPDTLRAPDVAVGNVPATPGWVRGAPPLALEYVDTGQDEGDLAVKIRELLASGTRYVWVVRLAGPRRVEVHEPGQAVRIVPAGEPLTAAGVLRNPVPVDALYDRGAAHQATLRNLLQRRGYESIEAIHAQGEAEGQARGKLEGERQALRDAIREVLWSRGLTTDEAVDAALARCTSPQTLRAWLRRAAIVAHSAEILE